MIRLTILLFFVSTSILSSQPIVMFPGDTNNDGVANQYDILPVGIAFGTEGFPRPGATLDWLPQFLPNQWFENLPVSGVNFGFIDSDGNGMIDSLDIDAIALNFDSMQFSSKPPPLPYLIPDTCFSCPKPDLLITFDRDTAMVTDTFYAILTLRYPIGVPPPFGALGIAFELNYDPENVKDSLTQVFPDTMPGDLMFISATTTIAKPWRAVPPGNIRFGAAGKGQNALFVTRDIGIVQIIVDDMILRSTADEFWMDAGGIMILNQNEQAVCLGQVEVDTITLFDPLNGTEEVAAWQSEVSVFPNPSSHWVHIFSPEILIENIDVFSISGAQHSIGWKGSSFEAKLDVHDFPKGIYLLKIKTSKGILIKKIKVE